MCHLPKAQYLSKNMPIVVFQKKHGYLIIIMYRYSIIENAMYMVEKCILFLKVALYNEKVNLPERKGQTYETRSRKEE